MPEQIAKNIYFIKIPLSGSPLKDLNSYLVKGSHRNLLIDTGFNNESCYQALRGGLKALGVSMENTDIFLTHLHADHSGLAGRIASPHSKIFIGEADKKELERSLSPAYWQELEQQFLAFGFSQSELDENKTGNPAMIYMQAEPREHIGVADNFMFDLGDCRLRCLDTPGHSPGHMCLYDDQRGILFSGDHVIFDITPNITSWSGMDNALAAYLQSLERIKTLPVRMALSAHRRAIGDCGARIDALIRHHLVRLEDVLRIIRESEGLTVYETASRMSWSIRATCWADFPVVQKWFAVGEASAHLEYLRLEGVLRR